MVIALEIRVEGLRGFRWYGKSLLILTPLTTLTISRISSISTLSRGGSQLTTWAVAGFTILSTNGSPVYC